MSDVDVNPIDVIRRTAEAIGGDKTDLRWKTSVTNTTSTPVPVTIVEPVNTTPLITNIVSPGVADTEFSHAFSSGTNKFIIKVRQVARLKVAFITGGTFISIPLGGVFEQTNLSLTSITVFLKCSKALQDIEILEWT